MGRATPALIVRLCDPFALSASSSDGVSRLTLHQPALLTIDFPFTATRRTSLRLPSMIHSAETVAVIGVASVAPSAASHRSLLHGWCGRGK